VLLSPSIEAVGATSAASPIELFLAVNAACAMTRDTSKPSMMLLLMLLVYVLLPKDVDGAGWCLVKLCE
jgi:hypothetical protein